MLKRIALAGCALVAAVGLAGAGVRIAGRLLQSRYPAPGRMVSAGPERLHLYCMGAGTPAVILESGTGVDWSGWYLVAPKIAEFTRVCVYDRGGYGWSDSGPRPRTAGQLAEELHALLSDTPVAPPYILVAHSYGAYVARVYASRFTDSFAGMVLVDPQSEDEPLYVMPLVRKIARMLPPVDVQRLGRMIEGERAIPTELRAAPSAFQRRYLVGASARQLQAERDEVAALPESEAEVRAAQFPGDLPLTVISARHLISPHEIDPPKVPEPSPLHRALHAKLAAQSSRGKLMPANDSGHMVQLDQPELIVEAVREMCVGNR